MAFVDVTTLAQSKAQQQVLIAERNHRVKNMQAVVTTIVRSSLRASKVAPETVTALKERLQSMARAYSLLNGSAWTHVNVHDIARTGLDAFGEARVTVSGPDVDVELRQSLALSMVSTNWRGMPRNAARFRTARTAFRSTYSGVTGRWNSTGRNATVPARKGRRSPGSALS